MKEALAKTIFLSLDLAKNTTGLAAAYNQGMFSGRPHHIKNTFIKLGPYEGGDRPLISVGQVRYGN